VHRTEQYVSYRRHSVFGHGLDRTGVSRVQTAILTVKIYILRDRLPPAPHDNTFRQRLKTSFQTMSNVTSNKSKRHPSWRQPSVKRTYLRISSCARPLMEPRRCTCQLVRVADLPGRRCLRSARTNLLLVPSVKLSTVGGRAFPVAGPTIWNSLPDNVTSAPSLSTFRQRLKTFLFQASFSDIITDPR